LWTGFVTISVGIPDAPDANDARGFPRTEVNKATAASGRHPTEIEHRSGLNELRIEGIVPSVFGSVVDFRDEKQVEDAIDCEQYDNQKQQVLDRKLCRAHPRRPGGITDWERVNLVNRTALKMVPPSQF